MTAGTAAHSDGEEGALKRPAQAAGLILAGGQSRRMGRDKAGLRFGPETLLALAVRRTREVAHPVVVSLGPEQALASGVSASDVIIVRDEQAYGGPLPGLLRGFRALSALHPAPAVVLVMPVDLPFYRGEWMRRALEGLADHQACLYRYEGYVNALVGAYEVALLPKLERLAGLPKARPLALSDGEPTRVLELETLWRPEDGPAPLMDTDTPEDYRMALALAGMGHPEGVPVAVTLPGAGTMQGEQLLLARKAQDASVALARLYPEWSGALPLLERIAQDGSVQPLEADDALRPSDRLRWLAGRGHAP